jgi:3-oxoacyl-[acyl-carrier protein] reductase
MGLEERTALVTGAGGNGIGRAIALALARDGADVALNWHRKRDGAERTAAAIEAMGRRAALVEADVGDATSVDALVETAAEQLGTVDILVNSAGGPWKPQDVTEIDPAHLRRVLANEIEATFYLLRAVLPGMRARGWGRVISIGGHGADDWRFGPPEAPVDYPLGKAARHWLTRTLAPREFERGITINAIAPGPTPRATLEEAIEALRGARPAARGSTPHAIAEIAAFLCSDAASHVTGAVIPVPGAKAV